MADESVRTSDFPIKTGLAANDSVVANWSNASSTNTVLVTVASLLGNSAADHVVTNGHFLVLANTYTPANSTAAGTAGTVTWDSSYVYVCVANGAWQRVAISSW